MSQLGFDPDIARSVREHGKPLVPRDEEPAKRGKKLPAPARRLAALEAQAKRAGKRVDTRQLSPDELKLWMKARGLSSMSNPPPLAA